MSGSGMRGTTPKGIIVDELSWPVPADMDPQRYSRLRDMKVNRQSSWSAGVVGISLTHAPTGTVSRSVKVSVSDSTSQEVVMAAVIDVLARELEIEILVIRKLTGDAK